MDEVLARFREEYLTILESNAKSLTPQEVNDAVTKVYKAQLKAFHLFGKALKLQLTDHQDRTRKLVKDKLDEIIPSQPRYEISALLMEGIKEAVQDTFGTSLSSTSQQPLSTSTNLQIQALQTQVSTLQLANESLTTQVSQLIAMVQSQHADIQTFVDSHKHLQMQNSVSLGAIMGALNIPFHALPEVVRPEISTPLILPANKTKGEIEARDSLNNNFFTYKKTLDKTVNFLRVIMIIVDGFQERRIVVNINDSGVDMYIEVSLNYLITRRALELDILINKFNRVIQEDTLLLTELKKAQVSAFPEAYLQPSKEVDDLDDDEQKKNDQKPSSSNLSQSSKAISSKSEDKKRDDKKRDDDYFQQLVEEIVKVWVVSYIEVRIYYQDGTFILLGSNLMDTLSTTEFKRVIRLMKDKDIITRAWKAVLCVWVRERDERNKKAKAKRKKKIESMQKNLKDLNKDQMSSRKMGWVDFLRMDTI
ncbi:hypothetical protein AgCh_001577 [Apium graveolens]